jgi:SH3 domain-containing YSC84-like protein 1
MNKSLGKMGKCRIGIIICSILIIFVIFAGPVVAADEQDAQGIVYKARGTLDEFMRNKDFSWLKWHLSQAKGVVIYPQVLKAGFIFGGSGGTGVLLVNNKGEWSQPAFYNVGSVTFGLQIGGETAELIMLLWTQKAVDALMTTKAKLGGDTSVAMGPVGGGVKGEVSADVMTFAKSKGLYAGLNMEGSVVDVREGYNKAYYGKAVTPIQIIVEKKVVNKKSEELRKALKGYVQ